MLAEPVAARGAILRNRVRRVPHLARPMHRRQRQGGRDQEGDHQRASPQLLPVTEQVIKQAKMVQEALTQQTTGAAQRRREPARRMLPRMQQGMYQTRHRVLAQQPLPSREKLVSRCEPHTRIIARLKAGMRVACGQHMVLSEVDGGIVTRWHLLEHATEGGELLPALPTHQRQCGHSPRVVAGARGDQAETNQRSTHEHGVPLIAIP